MNDAATLQAEKAAAFIEERVTIPAFLSILEHRYGIVPKSAGQQQSLCKIAASLYNRYAEQESRKAAGESDFLEKLAADLTGPSDPVHDASLVDYAAKVAGDQNFLAAVYEIEKYRATHQ